MGLLCAVGLSAQEADEWGQFFGEGGPAPRGAAAAADVEAAWTRLVTGPRFARLEARAALVAAGERAAPRLIPELNADSGEARRQAALTLGRIDTLATRPALRRAVEGRAARRDETRLRHAALALADLDDRSSWSTIIEQLGQVKRPLTRHLLLVAASRLGRDDPEAATQLLRLEDRDRSAAGRVVMTLALGQFVPSEESARALRARRISRREPLRLAAYLATAASDRLEARDLSRLRGERDARVLEAALLGVATGAFADETFARRHLGHELAEVRRAAALARGRAGSPEALEDLLERLEREREATVRGALLFALRFFSDEAVGPRLRDRLAAAGEREEGLAALLALELGTPGRVDLAALVTAARGLELPALDLLLRRDPVEARALAQRLVEGEAKTARQRALVAAARALLREDDDHLARRLASIRIQRRIDDAGWSADWALTRLANETFKEALNLDRPVDGRETIRVSPSGALRPIPQMNKEEVDLRLWIDRHPLFDRRRAPELPELGEG